MTKQAIVAHAAERAIVDFGPNFSAWTDFSSPAAQKHTFPPEQICLGGTFPPHFNDYSNNFLMSTQSVDHHQTAIAASTTNDHDKAWNCQHHAAPSTHSNLMSVSFHADTSSVDLSSCDDESRHVSDTLICQAMLF